MGGFSGFTNMPGGGGRTTFKMSGNGAGMDPNEIFKMFFGSGGMSGMSGMNGMGGAKFGRKTSGNNGSNAHGFSMGGFDDDDLGGLFGNMGGFNFKNFGGQQGQGGSSYKFSSWYYYFLIFHYYLILPILLIFSNI